VGHCQCRPGFADTGDGRRGEEQFAAPEECGAKGWAGQVIAAILFCLSVVAFGQFALYYWRASIAAASTGKVSDHVRIATGISAASIPHEPFGIARQISKHSTRQAERRRLKAWRSYPNQRSYV